MVSWGSSVLALGRRPTGASAAAAAALGTSRPEVLLPPSRWEEPTGTAAAAARAAPPDLARARPPRDILLQEGPAAPRPALAREGERVRPTGCRGRTAVRLLLRRQPVPAALPQPPSAPPRGGAPLLLGQSHATAPGTGCDHTANIFHPAPLDPPPSSPSPSAGALHPASLGRIIMAAYEGTHSPSTKSRRGRAWWGRSCTAEDEKESSDGDEDGGYSRGDGLREVFL
ncbi:unnamed protein product [Urochloa humidicola]